MPNNEKQIVRLLIVDDHQMVRDGIRVMLESQNKIFSFVITEAENGETAIKYVLNNSYDIVLIDYQLPKMSGMETVERILLYKPNTKILALSNYDELSYINNMLKAGASGYILKNVEPSELIAAIKTILENKAFYSNEVAVKIIENKKNIVSSIDQYGLTKRELEILKFITQEKSNDQISEILNISKRTVDSHRQNLLNKLHVKNTVGLTKIAIELRLI
jgi:DNA-binding NarL/FixJ family response regulator